MHEHVAVVIDGLGGRRDELYLAANNDGHAGQLAWAGTFGRVHSFGLEGTASYGIGVAGSRSTPISRPHTLLDCTPVALDLSPAFDS